MLHNPVKAKLCSTPEIYAYCEVDLDPVPQRLKPLPASQVDGRAKAPPLHKSCRYKHEGDGLQPVRLNTRTHLLRQFPDSGYRCLSLQAAGPILALINGFPNPPRACFFWRRRSRRRQFPHPRNYIALCSTTFAARPKDERTKSHAVRLYFQP